MEASKYIKKAFQALFSGQLKSAFKFSVVGIGEALKGHIFILKRGLAIQKMVTAIWVIFIALSLLSLLSPWDIDRSHTQFAIAVLFNIRVLVGTYAALTGATWMLIGLGLILTKAIRILRAILGKVRVSINVSLENWKEEAESWKAKRKPKLELMSDHPDDEGIFRYRDEQDRLVDDAHSL